MYEAAYGLARKSVSVLMKKHLGIVTPSNDIEISASWREGTCQITFPLITIDNIRVGEFLIRCTLYNVSVKASLHKASLTSPRVRLWITPASTPLPTLDTCDMKHYYDYRNSAHIPQLERMDRLIQSFLGRSRVRVKTVYLTLCNVFAGSYTFRARDIKLSPALQITCNEIRTHSGPLYVWAKQIYFYKQTLYIDTLRASSKLCECVSPFVGTSDSTDNDNVIAVRIRTAHIWESKYGLGVHGTHIKYSPHTSSIKCLRVVGRKNAFMTLRNLRYTRPHISVSSIHITLQRNGLDLLEKYTTILQQPRVKKTAREPQFSGVIVEDYISNPSYSSVTSAPPSCTIPIQFIDDYFTGTLPTSGSSHTTDVKGNIHVKSITLHIYTIGESKCAELVMRDIYMEHLLYIPVECRVRRFLVKDLTAGSWSTSFYQPTTSRDWLRFSNRTETTLHGDTLHFANVHFGDAVFNIDELLIREITPILCRVGGILQKIDSMQEESVTYFKDTIIDGFSIIISYKPRGINLGKLVQLDGAELLRLGTIRDSSVSFSRFAIESSFSYGDMFSKVVDIWEAQIMQQGSNLISHLGVLRHITSIGVRGIEAIRNYDGVYDRVSHYVKGVSSDVLDLVARSSIGLETLVDKIHQIPKKSKPSTLSKSPQSLRDGWRKARKEKGVLRSVSLALLGLQSSIDPEQSELNQGRYNIHPLGK